MMDSDELTTTEYTSYSWQGRGSQRWLPAAVIQKGGGGFGWGKKEGEEERVTWGRGEG